jgi:hemerythrin-like domain-containing protein
MGWFTNLFKRKVSTPSCQYQEELILLSQELKLIQEHLETLDRIVLTIIEQSGGEGWVHLVQLSLSNLDTRLSNVEAIIARYIPILERFFEEDDSFQEPPPPKDQVH